MNFLFDIGHPRHVHLFKNPRSILVDRGHTVHFLARQKDVTHKLLDDLDIDYFEGSTIQSGIAGRARELCQWFLAASRVIRKQKIDLIASVGSPGGAWAARLRQIPHLSFNTTETAIEQRLLYYPASVKVFTPECLKRNYGKKHVRYAGLHDLAYLRPGYFTPDPEVRRELGLDPEEPYAIVRFVSWQATHDWGRTATSQQMQCEIVERISREMKVFVTSEKHLPPELAVHELQLRPSRLHDALAFANLAAGDGAATLTEAAVLGRPSIYISPFKNDLGYLQFLESYRLLISVESLEEALTQIDKQLAEPEFERRKKHQKQLFADTIDVAEFIADQCEKYAKR